MPISQISHVILYNFEHLIVPSYLPRLVGFVVVRHAGYKEKVTPLLLAGKSFDRFTFSKATINGHNTEILT